MATYTTKVGDLLDDICFKFYGQSQGYLEAVLNHNYRLAEEGPILPAGVLIALPEFDGVGVDKHQIKLWS